MLGCEQCQFEPGCSQTNNNNERCLNSSGTGVLHKVVVNLEMLCVVECFVSLMAEFTNEILHLSAKKKRGGIGRRSQGQDVDHVNILTDVDTNLLIQQLTSPFHASSIFTRSVHDRGNFAGSGDFPPRTKTDSRLNG